MMRRASSRVAACVLAASVLAGATAARAQCQFSWLNAYFPDAGYLITAPDIYAQDNVSAPNWVVIGAIATDPTDDYDIGVYEKKPVWNPCPQPECFCTLFANSVNFAGRTDFVIGDFNSMPTAPVWVWTHCYSGHCDNQVRGVHTWRSGATIGVNALETSVSIVGGGDYAKVLNVYDVHLVSGTKYYFRFQETGDRQMKMLLFRNPGGGPYWVGRNAAVLETNQCVTVYTAPSTGDYGLVVVQDRLTVNDASYAIEVRTSPPCNCPGVLVDGVPQTLSPADQVVYDLAIQPDNFWEAVGVRATGDWDVEAGLTPGSGLNVGCASNTLAASTLTAGLADVIAGDYNFSYPALPETVSVRFSRFSSSVPAAAQQDGGHDGVHANGSKQTGTMYADDVVRIYDALLWQDTTYTFSLATSGANQTLLLFDNPTQSMRWTSRAQAVFSTQTTGTYKALHSGFYGFAVVKDDANVGGYTASLGYCSPQIPLTNKTMYVSGEISYCTFNQPAGRWGAVAVFPQSPYDWDLRQYDQPSGLTWPDCFGSPGALSNLSSSPDVIVGDFHHNPPGAQYVRAYPFTTSLATNGYTEWDSGSGSLAVNGAPATVTMVDDSDRLWCYEVFLIGGSPYTFEFSRIGSADTHLLVFANPTGGVYWAPRSAALLSGTSNIAYTPPATGTGWYGVVVVSDNGQPGRFTLRVSSTVVGVAGARAPERDALRGITPNPATGPLRIGFDLASGGTPSFEMLDLQGRVVSRMNAGTWGPGRWELPLADDPSRPITPGVYFVRMSLGARTVGMRKVAVVR